MEKSSDSRWRLISKMAAEIQMSIILIPRFLRPVLCNEFKFPPATRTKVKFCQQKMVDRFKMATNYIKNHKHKFGWMFSTHLAAGRSIPQHPSFPQAVRRAQS
jgi:hypothetical protein